MSPNELDEEAIFEVARKIESAEARADYLDQACGISGDRRERIEMLLAAYDDHESFLERPPAELALTADNQAADNPRVFEQPGDVIGPYKLLQKIGEGGMGTVFMAEQTSPVARRVALKIIKPGMDSKAVVARFEAERQALAMMDHPNISKVFDAGATEQGRPYFVMEYVKGIPITDYCDRQKLDIQERLELFTLVCHAVHHAHQKGIIHRDIKPTNVLVAKHDEKPVPMIIDFGVAKAISHRLTAKTLFTEHGQIVGTLEYMSPEQAQFNQLDVDTRSDIYSLGVLLYELLTGQTPFDGKRLRSSAFEEILRILREEEPPRPSRRISTLGEDASSVSSRRATDPKKLGSVLRGDLDWIIVKSLEKDRNRRYDSAVSLARDVSSYLAGESVSATPPTLRYRASKYFKRHRAAILAAGLVIGSLSAGLIVAIRQQVIVTRTAGELQESLNANLVSLKQIAVELAFNGSSDELDAAIDRARSAGASKLWAKRVRAMSALFSGRYTEAEKGLLECSKLGDDSVAIHALLSELNLYRGQVDQCFSELVEAAKRRGVGDDDDDELFFALAAVYGQAEQSMTSADRIFSKRNSPIALTVSAKAKAWLAMQKLDLARAESALQDIRAARLFFNKSDFVETSYVHILWAVLRIATIVGDKELVDECVKEAELIADSPLGRSLSSFGTMFLACLFQSAEKDVKAEEFFAAAIALDDNNWALAQYAKFLAENGRPNEAIDMLDKYSSDETLVWKSKAIVLGEIPERRDESIRASLSMARRDAIIGFKVEAIMNIATLGDAETASKVSNEIASKPNVISQPWDDLLSLWTENGINATEIVAKYKDDRLDLFEVHRGLSVYYYAKGQYEEARTHAHEALKLPKRTGSADLMPSLFTRIDEKLATLQGTGPTKPMSD